MSNSNAVRTIVVPWRKICVSLPAVALMSAGIAFAAPVSPLQDFSGVAVSSDSTAIVVPDTAMTMPAGRSPEWTNPFSMAAPEAPGLVPSLSSAPVLVSPEGTMSGGSGSVALDGTGIPVRALEAYHAAALLVDAADPGCHVDWALLAAFGRVESNHARFGGNQLDSSGVAQPGIIGPPLDGTNGTARILDSDGGRLDRDPVYDRAVGPMQFIPGTWRVMGVDADGDGVKNPQDMADSASATAVYVCSGPGDLNRPGDLHAAIMRYNASEAYTSTVTALAATYRLGVSALPAPDVPTANSAPSPFVATSAPSPLIAATSTPPTSFVTRAAPISHALTPEGRTPTAQTPAGLNPAAPEPAAAAPEPAAAAPEPTSVTTPVTTTPVTTTPPVTATPPVTTTPPVTATPPVTCPPQPRPTDPVPTVVTTPGPCPPDPCLPVPTTTPTPTPATTPTTGTLHPCSVVPTGPSTP